MSRVSPSRSIQIVVWVGIVLAFFGCFLLREDTRPNVILIVADDLGFSDVGFHGNPTVQTPALDQLSRRGVELTHFFVTPMCAPSRASILTGRYNFRTGVTGLGSNATLKESEVTIAQILRQEGYRTAIFGKWHLGDNYPMNPNAKGFEEALVFKGGQFSGPNNASSYFDPVLLYNGDLEQRAGYCGDLWFDDALSFIEKNQQERFFVYLSANLPHAPLEVPKRDLEVYEKMGLQGRTARLYAMISNLDGNIGRLVTRLKELELYRNTLLVFLSDNGPAFLDEERFSAGLLGIKGDVYDGGIRVPCLFNWPEAFERKGRKISRMAAHIDIFPTIAEAVQADLPAGLKLDGKSLMPLLQGQEVNWEDRTLVFQWHPESRLDGYNPQMHRGIAVRTEDYKLVQWQGAGGNNTIERRTRSFPPERFKFELFRISSDPGEVKDIAQAHPEVVADLTKKYEAWYRETSSEGWDSQAIYLGTENENPVVLGPASAISRLAEGQYAFESTGQWFVDVKRAGSFNVDVKFTDSRPIKFVVTPSPDVTVHLKLGDLSVSKNMVADVLEYSFDGVHFGAGQNLLEVYGISQGKRVCPLEVKVTAVDVPLVSRTRP